MTNASDTDTTEAAEGQDASSPEEVTDAWRSAIAARRTREPEGVSVAAAQASRIDRDVSRRKFIRTGFWAGMGASLAGMGVYLGDFIYPRGITGFGGPVAAGNVSSIRVGAAPKHYPIGQFWLANLDPSESRPGGSGGGEGLLALWQKCPHLGCTVPWKSGFTYDDDKGWFRCPCHGSTYTKAGVRVFGPAPRSMDTMAIDIDANGNITVQTGDRTSGAPDNPQRALKLS